MEDDENPDGPFLLKSHIFFFLLFTLFDVFLSHRQLLESRLTYRTAKAKISERLAARTESRKAFEQLARRCGAWSLFCQLITLLGTMQMLEFKRSPNIYSYFRITGDFSKSFKKKIPFYP